MSWYQGTVISSNLGLFANRNEGTRPDACDNVVNKDTIYHITVHDGVTELQIESRFRYHDAEKSSLY